MSAARARRGVPILATGLVLSTLALGTARAAEPSAPVEVQLSGVGNVSRWAYVLHRVVARSGPTTAARPVGVVAGVTPEDETDLVLVQAAVRDEQGQLWLRVALTSLPNGRTGWVPREALGDLHIVRTHLVIDRARFSAVLLRDGRVVFRTVVGVGRPQWPTPRGEFYIRVRLEHFDSAMYGPVAFGTNARQPWLTDWPKGGVVGIHGTDTPQLLPGRISHGCIRLRNDAILRLARLMPLGTPVSIR
jgi:lipoprotein-anchoring transpeptidase ErfK/SrfK